MNARLPVFLALLLALLASIAHAEELPDQRPLLRIEAGMHTAPVWRIGASADGRLLATGSIDKTARLWSLPDFKLLKTFRVPIADGGPGQVYAVALSPDGRTLAASGWVGEYGTDRTDVYVHLFDTVSGALIKRLGPVPDGVNDIAFSPDGRSLAAGIYGIHGFRLWTGDSFEEYLGDETPEGSTNGVAFSPNGRLLAAASEDGFVRTYLVADGGFFSQAERKLAGGQYPHSVAFSPDGTLLAVSYYDTANLDILDSGDLSVKSSRPIGHPGGGANLKAIAWSHSGESLYAAGHFVIGDHDVTRDHVHEILRFDQRGSAPMAALGGSTDTVNDLAALPDGGIVFSSDDPALGSIAAGGRSQIVKAPVAADMRGKIDGHFQTSPAAAQVWFGLGQASRDAWLFDADALTFEEALEPPAGFSAASTEALQITGWRNAARPSLNGTPLSALGNEVSRSLAIAPDRQSFFIGAESSISRFDAWGLRVWRAATAGIGWGLATSADGATIAAALGDGTIRWYRASDGAELLALFVHVPDKRWVAWTPSGYYAASPGGEDLIGWHVNGKTWNDPVEFYPASRFRDRFYRPDIVKLVLKTKDEARAIREANDTAKRVTEDAFARKDLPPVIEIIADPRGVETDKPVVPLQYALRTPSGRPVSAIEIRVDGALVDTHKPRGFVEVDASKDEVLNVPVPPRDSALSLVAVDDEGKKSVAAETRVIWIGAKNAAPERRLFALLVGVSAYADPDLRLGYAAKDARDLAAVLQQQQGRFFKSIETELLLDGEATAANILSKLAALKGKAGPDDYTIVFMAGHGLTAQNGEFQFVPADQNFAGIEKAAAQVNARQIGSLLSALDGKVLFFIDACYSANAIKTDINGLVNRVTGEANAVMMYTSSSPGQVSFERAAFENGVFTEALMAILGDQKSYNEDGEIITDELAAKLRQKVWKFTDKKQTPIGQASQAVPPFPVAGL